ncbi:MAG: 4Fe-4S ferredoxin [Promethearchaeia archaeon]|nr:MAG: 4Fe-4S ferredoxin [Candidatus Lokiarchaeia archaeon]
MVQLGFFIDQTRCIGCQTCSVACKDWYDIQDESINFLKVKYFEKGKFPDIFISYLPTPCYHCSEPLCAIVCPEHAITKNEISGIVTIDQDKCVGNETCGAKCLKACPYDVPQFGSESNSKMQKCNFCINRLEKNLNPICVDACPLYAIEYGPIDELRLKHGNNYLATNFKYSNRCRPSIFHKPKLK